MLEALVLVFNIRSPRGLGEWIFYVAPVLLCLFAPRAWIPLATAGLSTVLLAVGYWASDPGPMDVLARENRELGAVIERLSGQSFRDFFRSRVFELLGMKDTFSVPDSRVRDRRCATGCVLDDGGDFVEHEGTDLDDIVGSGSIYSTAMDLCLYDRALAANALVSAASMREALTSGKTNDGESTDYGFGWYVGAGAGATSRVLRTAHGGHR